MKRRKNKRSLELHIVPGLVATAFFMQTLDNTILNTALPAIAQDLGENPLQIQSVILSYVITVALFLPLSGWLSDRFGSRRVFMSAILLFTLGSLFCAMSETLTGLVMSRIFQGVGGALLVPVGRLEVLKLYPKRLLVPILSAILVPGLVGPLIGPVLGGFLVEYASWHWIFLINLPVGFISFILCYYWFPNMRTKQISPFDILGFVIFAIFVLSISIAINETRVIELSRGIRAGLFIGGMVMLLAYYIYAKYHTSPLFSLEIFKIRVFVIGLLGNVCSRISGGALPFLTPLMLQVALGFSPFKAGMMLLAMGAMVIIGKMFAPRLIKDLGFRTYLIINTSAIAALTMCFYFIGHGTPDWVIVLLLGVLGIFNSLQFTGLTTVTLTSLTPEYASEGNSLLSVSMQISMSLGVGAAGLILGTLMQYMGITDGSDVLPVFHCTYIIVGLLTVASLIPYFFLPGKK